MRAADLNQDEAMNTSPKTSPTREVREALKAAHNRFHGRYDTHAEVAKHARWTAQELENVQIEDEELMYDEMFTTTRQAARDELLDELPANLDQYHTVDKSKATEYDRGFEDGYNQALSAVRTILSKKTQGGLETPEEAQNV